MGVQSPSTVTTLSTPLRLTIQSMSETGDEMVIYHARTLHHCIAGGGADEGEAEILESLAHLDARLCRDGDILHSLPVIDDWFPIDEGPEEVGEGALIGSEVLDEGASIVDGGLYLGAVADDACICYESFDVVIIIGGYLDGIESIEGGAIILTPPKDLNPR